MVAAALLGILGVLVNPRPAYACSCMALSSAQALRQADAVFVGTVTKKTPVGSESSGWTDVRFQVSRVYKGTVYSDQVVATAQQSAGCGLNPDIGSAWVIFADFTIEGTGKRTVERLATTLCSGNLPRSGAPTSFGAGRGPLAGASDRAERATNTDGAVTTGVVVAGVTFLALGLLLAVVIALAWRPRR
jgi:hypothetical protein